MKQGKLFPLSVLFLTCCSLQAAAERNLTTNMAPAATLSAMQSVRAQQTSGNVKITGTVVDNTGEPAIGATVRVKNGQHGVVTDIDGKFTIDVPKGSTLVVSYIGTQTQEVQVGNTHDLHITMQPTARQIDEVVVTALGIKRSEKALS